MRGAVTGWQVREVAREGKSLVPAWTFAFCFFGVIQGRKKLYYIYYPGEEKTQGIQLRLLYYPFNVGPSLRRENLPSVR